MSESPAADDSRRAPPSLNASPRALATNAASGYLTLLGGAALGFVVTPILVHHLGTVGFGTWSLILGAVTYLALLEAGLGTATITRVAAWEDHGDDALSRLLSTSLVLFCVAASLGIVVSLGLALLFPLLFAIPHRLAADARLACFFVGAWQSSVFMANVYAACLLGTGRMYIVNLLGFVVSALTSVVQVYVLLRGGGLIGLALTQLCGGLLTVLLYRHQVKRAFPDVPIWFTRADRAIARCLVTVGSRNAVTSVSFTLAFGSDVILVGLLLTPTAAAAYALALRGFALLQRLTNGVIGAIGPAHARAATVGSPERRFRLYCLSMSVSLSFALAGAITLAVYARPLLHLWLGAVPSETAVVLVLLCAGLVLQTPGLNAYALLINSEQTKELMIIVVAAAITNVLASIAFTVTFGIIGPALGSLAAIVAFDALYLPARVCRLLGVPYSRLGRMVLYPLLFPLGALAIVLVVGRLFTSGSVDALLVSLVGALVFVGVLATTQLVRDVWRLLRQDRPAPRLA